MSPPLDQACPVIVRVGAACPLGLTSLETAMCVRASKLEPRPTAFIDKRGRTVGASHARWLAAELAGFDRLVALGARALGEAAGDLTEPAPLVLALPEAPRPDDEGRFGPELVAALASASGARLDLERSAVVRAGSAGLAVALASATALLASGAPAVLVGGLDSYLHPDVIRGLDEECRLHAEGTDDGIVPSEGAGFALLAPAPSSGRVARVAHAGAIATLAHVATATEPPAGADEADLAVGMTRALHEALGTRAHRGPVGWILSDVNGEHHRVREWSTAEIRCGELLASARHDRLTGELGDVGAAAGALLLAIACTYLRVGCAPARSALVVLSSEGPARGVFVVEAAS
ncbi:MAG: hypothetical protein HY908_24740 [Myxococcales bacterium]|nr:hypothetical protein [Myxococcales bacterium]